MALPSGTVTFLFTDIEGSTQRWDRDFAAMQDAVRRHDELLRRAIESHGGSVFKTIGDAFCAAFPRSEDGVAASLAAQRAISAEDFTGVDGIRVRMALHTGTTDERDGDYYGPTVNRVARLLSIGHGGQILLSNATANLARARLTEGVTLREMGLHRLKDLSEVESVHQLCAPDLHDEFPALRSLDGRPHNLPRQLTSFVGREAELAEVTGLVRERRFVTLVGTGGVGKTRLALQAGAELLDHFSDGVWFVPLAPIRDGALVPGAIAAALKLRESPEKPVEETLLAHLTTRTALLVLDNCEHVIHDVASVAETILLRCPDVKILSSSREGLRIAGEWVHRLPSLPVASEVEGLTVAGALSFGAIALFVERARAADARFSITDENAPIVADICRRLDGIALAIELAAARVSLLSPKALLEKLDRQFSILTGGSRTALPRHQTMRATIEWSYDLLTEPEKAVFRRLGIFIHGFSLDGAVAVCADEAIDDMAVLDAVSSLADKSLLARDASADVARYRLFQATREYAREKLQASEEFERLSERHFDYLSDLFAKARAEYEKAPETPFPPALGYELEEVRCALDRAAQRGAPNDGADLFLVAAPLFQHFGLHRESLERAKGYTKSLDASDSLRLERLWARISYAATWLDDEEMTRVAAERALAYARALGDPEWTARALMRYVFGFLDESNTSSMKALLDEAESIAPPTPVMKLGLLEKRGMVAHFAGELAEATRCFEECRDSYRRAGNTEGASIATEHLAKTAFIGGENSEAIATLREAIALAQMLPDRGLYAAQLRVDLASFLTQDGQLTAAREAGEAALDFLANDDRHSPSTAKALESLALVHAAGGDAERAAILAGYAGKNTPKTRDYDARFTRKPLHAILRERLDEANLQGLLAKGAALSTDAAVALARD